MRLSRLNLIASFFLAAVLSAPAWGANQALPGTVNYVEGQVSVGNEALNGKSIGSITLEPGQTLTTQNGKAEILLTPGVFFRVGSDSAATLVSPSLTDTEIGLSKGQAMVEVDDIHKDNVLRVREDGTTTQLLKTGIYGFNANNENMRTLKGEALVQDGDHTFKLKGGHEFALEDNPQLKTTKFDKKEYEQSSLYRFSDLRSEYLAESNENAAGMYGPGGPGWYGPGWYWDPWFWNYTWLPGSGLFWGPFGWGFGSPLWFDYYGPIYYGPYTPFGYNWGPARPYHPGHSGPTAALHGFGGQPFHGPESAAIGNPHFGGEGFHGAPHFGVMGEGFHAGGFHAGGFQGGGFHGGGGFSGGGFHR